MRKFDMSCAKTIHLKLPDNRKKAHLPWSHKNNLQNNLKKKNCWQIFFAKKKKNAGGSDW